MLGFFICIEVNQSTTSCVIHKDVREIHLSLIVQDFHKRVYNIAGHFTHGLKFWIDYSLFSLFDKPYPQLEWNIKYIFWPTKLGVQILSKVMLAKQLISGTIMRFWPCGPDIIIDFQCIATIPKMSLCTSHFHLFLPCPE